MRFVTAAILSAAALVLVVSTSRGCGHWRITDRKVDRRLFFLQDQQFSLFGGRRIQEMFDTLFTLLELRYVTPYSRAYYLGAFLASVTSIHSSHTLKSSFCILVRFYLSTVPESLSLSIYLYKNHRKYQIHKRAIDGTIDAEDDNVSPKVLQRWRRDQDHGRQVGQMFALRCQNWNILGDADTGYVLTEGDGKICLVREVGTGKAMTAPCDSDEIRILLQLQFARREILKP
jgi:hypothetical protein